MCHKQHRTSTFLTSQMSVLNDSQKRKTTDFCGELQPRRLRSRTQQKDGSIKLLGPENSEGGG